MRQRLHRVLLGSIIFFASGICYALLCTYTPLRLPCLFYLTTHLRCPGCGITRLCLALLHFDFAAAWSANPVLFIMLPIISIYLIVRLIHYVRSGHYPHSKKDTVFMWSLIGILLAWGIIRNIYHL